MQLHSFTVTETWWNCCHIHYAVYIHWLFGQDRLGRWGVGVAFHFSKGKMMKWSKVSVIEGEVEQAAVLHGGGFLVTCINGWREWERDTASSQWCSFTGQYQWPQTKICENSSDHKKALLLWLWSQPGPDCHERLWSVHPWIYNQDLSGHGFGQRT